MAKKISTKTIESLYKPEEKVIDFNGMEIKVKQYLPIEEKMILIELVKENAFTDGVQNLIIEDVMTDVLLIKYYTNINIGENIMNFFDQITFSGLLDEVKNNIPEKELTFVENRIGVAVYNESCKLEQSKSISGVIESFLNKITDKIPNLDEMQNIISQVNNFDPEKLEMIKTLTGAIK
jgi:hypothetical protein